MKWTEKIIKLTVERNIIFGLVDSEKFAWLVENINEFPGFSLRLPWIQLSLSADRLSGRTGSQGKVGGNFKSLESMIYLKLCHLTGIFNMRKQLRIENVFIYSVISSQFC